MLVNYCLNLLLESLTEVSIFLKDESFALENGYIVSLFRIGSFENFPKFFVIPPGNQLKSITLYTRLVDATVILYFTVKLDQAKAGSRISFKFFKLRKT